MTERKPYFQYARDILLACGQNRVEGCVAAHSLCNIFYILRKDVSETDRRNFLISFCDLLQVEDIDSSKLIAALKNQDFKDFEDCLQFECAKNFSADYIVTGNIKDFVNSNVPAISPENFLLIMNNPKK